MSLPGSVRSARARKGHTKPRLFTPPLAANCDTNAERQCPCGCGLNPETSWGFECVDFLVKVMRWTLLPWQVWLYIHALEKDVTGHGYRYFTILLLIARQNGKTQWLKGLGLWRLYLDGAKHILVSAQKLEFAETTLAEAVADIQLTPLLRREFRRFSQTNGKFKLMLKPLKHDPLQEERTWRAAVSDEGGGRSLSIDLAMLDELRQHKNWKAYNSIRPTLTAVDRSLMVCASNAGEAGSVVLNSIRDRAAARITLAETVDDTTFLAEWSIPEDADYLDPKFWPLANPALGYLRGFTMAKLQGFLDDLEDDIAGWRTEHCCQRVASLEPGIIPASAWAATTDEHSTPADESPVWVSLDVNFQRSRAYVATWTHRDDGDGHMEVIEARRGTDWIVGWFVERADRFERTVGGWHPVVIQHRGAPASDFIELLRDADVPVYPLGGSELTRAYGHGYDLIVDTGRAWHRPSPALDEAAAAAQGRKLGDAWVIDRRNSPTDASPLVACIQAAAGELLQRETEVWGMAL
jgi:hypothetical protein